VTGLNDGMELDHEPQAQEEGEFDFTFDPDVEASQVEDARGAIDNLEYLRRDIVTSQGMNQTFALEAQRIMPGFINDDRPIGFFTKEPTSVLKSVSLESIGDGFSNAIKAIFEAIKKALARFSDWVASFFSKNNQEKSEIAQKISDDPKPIIEAVQALDKLQKQSSSSDKQLFEKIKASSDKLKNQISKILTAEGLDPSTPNYTVMAMISKRDSSAFDSVLKLEHVVDSFKNQFEKACEQVETSFRTGERPDYDLHSTDIIKLNDEIVSVFNSHDQIESRELGFQDIIKLFTVACSYRKRFDGVVGKSNEISKAVADVTKSLDKLQAVAFEHHLNGVKKAVKEEEAAYLHKKTTTMAEEMDKLKKFVSAFSSYVSKALIVARTLDGVLYSVFKLIEQHVRETEGHYKSIVNKDPSFVSDRDMIVKLKTDLQVFRKK
jgi:uncharacterized protein YicC (UPF0701 family)